MARTSSITSSTTTIRTVDSASHTVASKDQQLDVSSKTLKALNQVRRLLEKIKRSEDAERIIAEAANLSSPSSDSSVSTVRTDKPSVVVVEGLTDREVELLVASLYVFLSAVTRSKVSGLSADAFVAELQRLKFRANAGKILAGSIFKNLALMDESKQLCQLNKTRSVRWRLDVIITSQAGKRILEPVFLLELQTSTGTAIFEIPLTQFHKMRYATAAVLQEMQTLAGRKIMAP